MRKILWNIKLLKMELSELELFSTKENFKTKIDKIWEDSKDSEVIKLGYAVQDELIKKSLLFIGINPSYSEDKNSTETFDPFYKPPQQGLVHRYFKKFQDISEKVNVKWAHIDLLFLRETDQKNVEKIINEHPDFVYKQLMISKEIIENVQPKIIVVNNSLARRLLGFDKSEINGKWINEWINLDFEFDNDLGTHRIINNEELRNPPIFFTSMLTGQRALDNGSYERLVWHIKFVLGKLDKR